MLHATDVIALMPRLMMAGDLIRGTLRLVPLPIPTPGSGLSGISCVGSQ
jgi:LysR family pca operon transcriptional activator